MNFQNKSALLLSLSVMSPMAFAGPPTAFDEYTVIGGTITTACGVDVTCNTLVSDNGMLYEQVSTADGEFLRLIITDFDANGDASELAFSDESFIPFALDTGSLPSVNDGYNSLALPQGLASKQTLRDPTDNFVATTQIQRSNMRQYTGDWKTPVPIDEMFTIKIDQSFSNDEITSDFSTTAYTQFQNDFNNAADPDTDQVIGRSMDIDQTLDMSDTNNPAAKQLFVQRSRSGYKGTSTPVNYNSFGYFVTEPLVTAGQMNLSGDTTPVTWAAADTITTTWVVETADAAVIPVSYQSLNVNNDAAKQDSALIFEAPTGPIDWNANFGAAPTFP